MPYFEFGRIPIGNKSAALLGIGFELPKIPTIPKISIRNPFVTGSETPSSKKHPLDSKALSPEAETARRKIEGIQIFPDELAAAREKTAQHIANTSSHHTIDTARAMTTTAKADSFIPKIQAQGHKELRGLGLASKVRGSFI